MPQVLHGGGEGGGLREQGQPGRHQQDALDTRVELRRNKNRKFEKKMQAAPG